ncbi:MAG: helix-turn-helix domain-containing protein [Arenimonas sp.]|uniref:helix-turn-helix domain-containing protein n=1 Tax=Arenimonas sp. TaxID=1872635 RepID=UPI0025B7F444|nr:helix-turn-helix transcriptional regulator [Arenimonas sp.]MBW8367201.1 helix-turn-helix domain-containing protein [Arenimonas sp.]
MFQHASRIKQARKDAGLSQAALAERLGLGRTAVAQWERNTATGPTAGHLAAIALATGVSFEWLATGRGPRVIGGKGQEPPAIVMDYIAQSESEERLLVAFRSLSSMDQLPVLAKVEKQARR